MTAARTDSNQTAIVKALRQAGCVVQSLAAVGSGVPDLIWSRNGRMGLIEVKDGRKPPSARKLTPAQEKWHREWKGPIAIVKSVDEALEAVK